MARKYKATKPISLFSGGSASREGCGGPDDPIIFPGGGNCGGGGGACTGPDCPDPGTGDDPCLQINPPSYCDDFQCAVHCEDDKCGVELQQCIGPDCVDPADHPELDHLGLSWFEGFCIGLDCEYIGGKFHVYRECKWHCDQPGTCPQVENASENASSDGGACNVRQVENDYKVVGITLNYYTMTAPASFQSGGLLYIADYKHYIGSEEHYRLSSQEMGRPIVGYSGGGDGFYPARHGAHLWAYKGSSKASDIPHPWNFKGESRGMWQVNSKYGGILNSATDFGTNPTNLPLRQAMLSKNSVDTVYVYMGKTHCDFGSFHGGYRREFPFAVAAPGVQEANTDFLFLTGGKLVHAGNGAGSVVPRNWTWNFPTAYDLTDTCDSGRDCYDECMGRDRSGLEVKSIFLFPGGGGQYGNNGVGTLGETQIGTNECLIVEEEVVDCADPSACNYNPDPDIVHDADSCCYILGCTNPTAFNYNENACCDDGSCCYYDGCNDPAATNYDPLACFDDGSCCYISGCTNPTSSNYNPLACFDDGSCIDPSAEGYTYGLWCEHYTLPNGYTETNNYAYQLKPGMLSPGASSAFGTGPWGCTDQAPEMDVPQQGVEIKTNTGLNKLLQPGDTITPDNGLDSACTTYVGIIESPTDLVNGGQLDIGNSQTVQIQSSGPCPPSMPVVSTHSIVGESFEVSCSTCCDKITDPTCDPTPGCDEPLAENYNPSSTNIDNDICEWLVPRYCTDMDSFGFVTQGTKENVYLYGDSSLAVQPDITTGTLADNIVYFQNYLDNELPGPPSIPVIMFNTADGTASSEGPICFFWLGWDTYIGDGSIPFNSTDGFGGGPTPGLLGPYGSPSTSYSNIVSGGSLVQKNGAFACGTCGTPGTAEPSGCTDPVATNYDPYATIDDGSCVYEVVEGCMEDTSSDYNINATVENGNCRWEICCCNSGDEGCACSPSAINEGYLVGQFDINGMAIPLSQAIIDYNTLWGGTSISPTQGDSCITCDPEGLLEEGPYENTEGINKISGGYVMASYQHGNAGLVQFFGGNALNPVIILVLEYPAPSGLVINPNTNELDATNGIPGTPAYPQYGFDPAVEVEGAANPTHIMYNTIVNAVLDPTAGNVHEIVDPVSGTNIGKAWRLPNFIGDPGKGVRVLITRKGSGCQNEFEVDDLTPDLGGIA